MTTHRVPLVDLAQQQRQIDDTIREGFNRVIAESSFVLGPQVGEFEEAWASYCGTQFAVGVGNGTDAIELALRATGVGPGDEVIVPANTFVATAGAVMRAGAKLVLADCDADFLVDARKRRGKADTADQSCHRRSLVRPGGSHGTASRCDERGRDSR